MKDLWNTIILLDREGIKVDQINMIRFEIFFFSPLTENKRSTAASSQLELYSYVVKTGVLLITKTYSVTFSKSHGLSHAYRGLVQHLVFISQWLCG